jgi:hypothetical protein
MAMPSSMAMVLNSLATPPAAFDLARDQLAQVLEVHVAGHELGEGVGHGDDRLAEVAVLHAGGAPQARAPAMLRPPLSELIMRDAPLPVERSLAIVKQVASALGAAHDKGIVHRDVKPENVYLVRRGDLDFVKVVDFGVSKAVRTQEETGSEWQRLTRTGAVLGTPLFMSPEQAGGSEDIDARADIWATALILYECLTGELPFRGNNYLGVIAQIQNKDVQPPSALRPELGIPEAVDRMVMHGLEKDRTRRYQHMAAFEQDMERLLAGDVDVVLDGDAGAETGSSPRARRRWPWHLAVAAVFAFGIGSAALLARGGKEVSAAKATPVPAPAKPRPTPPAPPAATNLEPPRPVVESPPSTAGDKVRRPGKEPPGPPTDGRGRGAASGQEEQGRRQDRTFAL